jgi:hypothetical protein
MKFIPAISLLRGIPGFPGDFEHRICRMHKKKNFSEKVFSCGFSPEQRKTLNALFKLIAYSDNRRVVDNALNQITRLNNAALNSYMQKNIFPNLAKFSRSYLGPHFACGVTTTSAAESMNHMLKSGLGRRRLTLEEAFQHFANLLRFHDNERLLARSRYQRNEKVLSVVKFDLGPFVNARILCEIQGASGWEIEGIGPDHVVVKKKNVYYEMIFDTRDCRWNCECHLVEHEGIPCRHILALTELSMDERYVSQRWLLNSHLS